MPSVGVVLGAGGIVGAAYHAGVLTALAEAGFDARDADLIVGTSAGSAVGATLRAGFPPLDLAPRNLGEPISDEAASIVGRTGGPPNLDLRPRPFSRAPLPSSPKLLFRSARHPTKVLAGLLPTGTIATDVIGERISMMYGERSWPEQPLWICAVDLEHGDRVVFGRDAPDTTVGVAVQASSSIPGFFRPVEHDGRRYVDGGVHSPTNADLLAEQGFDMVLIVSPMSATRLAHGALLPNARPVHARRLASEVDRLRRSGTPVLTFQPTPDVVSAMGRNSMDSGRRVTTTMAALASSRDRLADPRVAERLELLREASRA
jgi:NTE family protein